MNRIKIKVSKTEDVLLPRYMSQGASGFDLHACIRKSVIIEPAKWAVIPTGIRVEIPQGFELQIRPRSGLATKGITVLNSPGTVDSDYRGEIKVILINLSDNPFEVRPGMRIAQGVITKVYRAEFVEAPLSCTERNNKGFGSTGEG